MARATGARRPRCGVFAIVALCMFLAFNAGMALMTYLDFANGAQGAVSLTSEGSEIAAAVEPGLAYFMVIETWAFGAVMLGLVAVLARALSREPPPKTGAK